MENVLPLSWSKLNSDNLSDNIIDLKFTKTKWISIANIPEGLNVIDYIESQSSLYKNILIRGCNKDLASSLSKLGYRKITEGKEAVIDLSNNMLAKKSLNELIKRGKKSGEFLEISNQTTAKIIYSSLKKHSVHGDEPQLERLYRTNIDSTQRVFAVVDRVNCLGLISITKNSKEKVHTELLVRSKLAPVGVMEFLIYSISQKLKVEGTKYFSLGEVPFITENNKGFYQNLFNLSGFLLSPFYNYKGLYKFKTKFSPVWNDVYICSKKRFKINHFFSLFISTKLHKFVSYKIKHFLA